MKLLLPLLSISILFIHIKSREIEVPAIYDNTPLSIKLGGTKVIKEPDFDFNKVYRRSVQKVSEKTTSRFPPCQ